MRRDEIDAARLRAQEGLLLRLARSEPEAFSLRGGMRIRQLAVGKDRPARDVDLVCHGGSQAAIVQRLEAALGQRIGDGVALSPERLRVDTMRGPFGRMGYRVITPVSVEGQGLDLHIDVRTDLLIWPPPTVHRFHASHGQGWLSQCAPETLLGRKLQVIVEAGSGRWRPKDLLDVFRLLSTDTLSNAVIEQACADAFATAGSSLDAARDAWASPELLGGRIEGHRWQRANRAWTCAPSLGAVRKAVRTRLKPILGGPR